MLQVQAKPEIEDIKPFYQFESLEIRTDADCDQAAMVLKEIKTRLDKAEAWRKEVTGPIKAGVKAFEDRVRQVTQPLEGIKAQITRKLGAYWDSQRAAKEEAERKRLAAEAAAAKQLAEEQLDIAVSTGSQTAYEAAQRFEKRAEAAASKPVEVSQTIRTTGAVVAQGTYYEAEVIDEKAIPDEYWILDTKRLGEIARGYSKNPVEIPGIRFVQKSRAIVR